MNKKQSERIHAKKRAAERYNFQYNRKILLLIKEMIAKHKSIILEHQSLNKTIRLIVIDNVSYKIVWDKKRKEVVTFLPIEDREIK